MTKITQCAIYPFKIQNKGVIIIKHVRSEKMANRERLKKRISLGLSLAQVMVQASLVYLAYKQYKLSKDY